VPKTYEQIIFFDSEDMQSESTKEETIAAELIEKNPDIYDIVLKEGVLDLVCECSYSENKDEANAD